MKTRYRFVNVVVSLALTLTALLAALPPAAVAQAVTCTVTSGLDDGTTPGTLRVLANDASCQVINFDDDYTIHLASTLTLDRDVTIDGTGHSVTLSGDTTGDGTGDLQVLYVGSGVTAALQHLSITKGSSGDGAGLRNAGNLTVADCIFSDNSATGTLGGGGIYNEGTLAVTDTTFSANSARQGGAIFGAVGDLSLTGCTFSGNSTSGIGGGLFNATYSTLAVTGCTFSGNSATNGGGIYNYGSAATVTNCTFSGNSATENGGGLYGDNPATVRNCLFVRGASGANCYGNVNGANNLLDEGTCGAGSINSPAILLGTLGDYGGATQTLPLLPGSAAIDVGDPDYCPASDQRGVARAGTCDIGAFESQGFTLGDLTGTPQSTLLNTAFAQPLGLTITANDPVEPVAGGLVTFTPPADGASAAIAGSPATVSGAMASVSATANGTLGAYDVTASAAGAADVTFQLTNIDTSYTLAVSGGDNQSTYVTTAFGKALEVTLKDGAGNPVPDVLVTFTAPASEASTNPATFTATTNNKGIASATATANGIVGGPYEVVASTDGLTATLHLTNDGVTLAVVAGDNHGTGVNMAFPVPLQVEVTGSTGKGVPGALVTFSGPDSGASITPALLSATSDKDGIASVTVTANGVQGGPYEVVASIGDVSGTFHLTNQYPYYMESRCEANTGVVDATSNQGLSCLTRTTEGECNQSSFCWWRDTAAQNALAEHSNTEFTGSVYTVYSDSALTVLVYSSLNGPNVTAVLGDSEALLIGTGGGREGANNAKLAFQSAYVGFTGKTLKGIVFLDANRESTWGNLLWKALFGMQVPFIVNASFGTAQATSNLVARELTERQGRALGTECSGSGCSQVLPWGTDGFLGTGSMRQYSPNLPSYYPVTSSDIFVSQPYNLNVDSVPVTLIPTTDENAGLIVHLPQQHIMIAGGLGTYLPDAGSITQPPVSVDERIATLDYMRHLGVEILIPDHALPIEEEQEVYNALTDQYNALSYLRSETLMYISYGYDVEDIVNTVRVPYYLANSPYARPFVGLEGYAVRQIYHEYLGWYDGDLLELSGGMNSTEFAVRLMTLAGGENPALNFVRQCLTEHNLSGARFALYVLTPLRRVYPSAEADRLYVSALRRVAYSTPSAELRNYFLSLAKDVPLQ